ncbi:putative proteasome regulatory non-ATP-ase subunit 2 [Trypanosoma rangeli]|uniref:Putative proteasome regulatory non-ATP-ase subunit 2 n=1 Tax=Trypanosoma rangeli TaxID=5698 RepID=A0A3R7KVS9_TRYRA|nr:putative proteasome regulatory non-ATP-ase subunit 2 [Trypanosoma rangeli]RNF10697.1 putative proteasome regulatory non-ATP-ase subunit 2 [Trypanosoma rangeli]|eukprot:RNF10697.1 putative proteasome regulatory non-ATP-ase subunit 2 [Trypanosoma rangeli]
MVVGLSSSKGVLALLGESDPDVLQFALKRLRELVDTYWYEISPDLPLIEELHESSDLSEDTRMLAALVASHVHFHLGAYNDSVHFALEAGTAFNYVERSLFTDTILSCCIDQFVQYQEQPEETRGKLDPRLDNLFTALTNKWILQEGTPVRELVGFTIRARRLDFLEKVLRQDIALTKSAVILNYTFDLASVLLRDIGFRRKILRLLAELYAQGGLSTIDYFSRAQCLLFLGDSASTTKLIADLMQSGDKATAYQLAFDLYEYGNQEFLSSIVAAVERAAAAEAYPALMMLPTHNEKGTTSAKEVNCKKPTDAHQKLLAVLTGETSASFYLKFLYAQCNADIHILNHIKQSIDGKKSVPHNATVIAHALMYSGTTIDAFLRGNMDWLSRANYWAKFVVTASIGAIHRGHIDEGLTVVEPYLPKESVGMLPYQEAGALYALGLIHAPVVVTRNLKMIEYLKNALRKYSTSEQIIHGASLGIGLAAMGLKDEELFDSLFACVSGCDAVASEGAALGIGLLMMGSGNRGAIQSMRVLAAEDNQKEKTIRGISMAVAIMMLGREDECWGVANGLLEDSDPWVRLGGCFMLGLGYAGAENTKVLERLLSVAVKDTSDDVRRNATTMIGFLTIKDPTLCLELTRVLVDSYNPHIRYGVGMALAVAAAGTGDSAVIEVLWTLKDDLVDFVRQGAYIALAIVMVQLTAAENSKVKEFRDLLSKKIAGRKEDMCSKFGSIIATGLLDAGGRNCTFALHRQRHRLDKAVVGMFVFLQHWYWFPYLLMITLAMRPTCFIGLNDNLDVPEYTLKSNAPPSRFALPKSVLAEKKEARAAAVKAVILSTTKREEQFNRLKRMSSSGKAQETAAKGATTSGAEPALPPLGADTEKKKEPEPAFELLKNPTRVSARQFAIISHDVDGRYMPLKPNPTGICLLHDTKPSDGKQKIVSDVEWNSADDAPPPEPFTWP